MNTSLISMTLFGLFCSFGIAAAKNRIGAIDNFIRPIIAKELPKSGNSAEWDGSGNGGYLFRYLIDVTGDGRAEILVSSSLASFSNRSEWKVFDVSPNGEMMPYEGVVNLIADAVWVARAGGTTELRCEWPPDFDSDEGLKNRLLPEGEVRHLVSRIEFAYPKINEIKASVTDEEAVSLRAGSTDTKAVLEVMLLADYLTNETATWQAVPEWRSNSADYYHRPEDAVRINELSSFTPQVAISLLGAAQSDTVTVPNAKLRTQKQVQTPIVTTSPVPKILELKPESTSSDKAASLTSWSIIVVLIVAAFGLLGLILKKRK
jgi:hypothetical protein